MTPYELNKVAKTQNIRLLDVFVLGPLMIYSSGLIPAQHAAVRGAMFFFGVTTIGYNWRNYNRVRNA
jgi:hypothetical protein